MKRKTRIATVLLLGAVPLAALATDQAQPSSGASPRQSAPPAKDQAPPMFKELDSNLDGYITKPEAARSADVTARFAQLDANHDGKISVAEYNEGLQKLS